MFCHATNKSIGIKFPVGALAAEAEVLGVVAFSGAHQSFPTGIARLPPRRDVPVVTPRGAGIVRV